MVSLNTYLSSIYGRMAAALVLSAGTAWLTVHSPLIAVLQTPVLFYGIVAVELALMFGVQMAIHKISTATASALFIAYAALNGITMSGFLLYFLTKNFSLVVVIFLVAASAFTALAFLGHITKHDMSGWRTFLFVAVWGIFFSSLANMYFQNSLLDMIISAGALLVFSALTVYDAQYYKHLHATLTSVEQQGKAITLGALHMYINFIMIFQNLLNLAGDRE